MAEKPPGKDAARPAPASVPKPEGNPALRMMGRSVSHPIIKNSKLTLGIRRSTQIQIQAPIPQLAHLLGDNRLFHIYSSV